MVLLGYYPQPMCIRNLRYEIIRYNNFDRATKFEKKSIKMSDMYSLTYIFIAPVRRSYVIMCRSYNFLFGNTWAHMWWVTRSYASAHINASLTHAHMQKIKIRKSSKFNRRSTQQEPGKSIACSRHIFDLCSLSQSADTECIWNILIEHTRNKLKKKKTVLRCFCIVAYIRSIRNRLIAAHGRASARIDSSLIEAEQRRLVIRRWPLVFIIYSLFL